MVGCKAVFGKMKRQHRPCGVPLFIEPGESGRGRNQRTRGAVQGKLFEWMRVQRNSLIGPGDETRDDQRRHLPLGVKCLAWTSSVTSLAAAAWMSEFVKMAERYSV